VNDSEAALIKELRALRVTGESGSAGKGRAISHRHGRGARAPHARSSRRSILAWHGRGSVGDQKYMDLTALSTSAISPELRAITRAAAISMGSAISLKHAKACRQAQYRRADIEYARPRAWMARAPRHLADVDDAEGPCTSWSPQTTSVPPAGSLRRAAPRMRAASSGPSVGAICSTLAS